MTFPTNDIPELATALAESGLAELRLSGPGTDIHLVRPATADIDNVAPGCAADIIVAPCVGIILTRHPLHTVPLAGPGRVRAGQTVALLRVGLLLCPVVAPAAGVLGAPLAEDGAMVGFDTPLFPLHPEQPEAQR